MNFGNNRSSDFKLLSKVTHEVWDVTKASVQWETLWKVLMLVWPAGGGGGVKCVGEEMIYEDRAAFVLSDRTQQLVPPSGIHSLDCDRLVCRNWQKLDRIPRRNKEGREGA